MTRGGRGPATLIEGIFGVPDFGYWSEHKAWEVAVEVCALREFYVLDGRIRDRMTLAALGSELGVSIERVRQIEAKGLRRLRHPERRERYRE